MKKWSLTSNDRKKSFFNEKSLESTFNLSCLIWFEKENLLSMRIPNSLNSDTSEICILYLKINNLYLKKLEFLLMIIY